MAEQLKLIPQTPFVVPKQLDRLVVPCTVRDPKGLRFWEIQPAVDELNQNLGARRATRLKVLTPSFADLLIANYPLSLVPYSPFVVDAAVAYGKPEDKLACMCMVLTSKDGLEIIVDYIAMGMLGVEAFNFLNGKSDGSLLNCLNAFRLDYFFSEYIFDRISDTAISISNRDGSLEHLAVASLVFIPPKSGWYKPGEGSSSHLLVPCEATDPQAVGYVRAEGPLVAPIVRRVSGLGDDSKILYIDSDPDTAFHHVLLEMPASEGADKKLRFLADAKKG